MIPNKLAVAGYRNYFEYSGKENEFEEVNDTEEGKDEKGHFQNDAKNDESFFPSDANDEKSYLLKDEKDEKSRFANDEDEKNHFPNDVEDEQQTATLNEEMKDSCPRTSTFAKMKGGRKLKAIWSRVRRELMMAMRRWVIVRDRMKASTFDGMSLVEDSTVLNNVEGDNEAADNVEGESTGGEEDTEEEDGEEKV
ncbi:hypothetical protein BC829DRAFT_437329 [Chytridium lagenaria]|nr:hypothetical protein BC829DRAFT_437329 [Chytridium lagenaria]